MTSRKSPWRARILTQLALAASFSATLAAGQSRQPVYPQVKPPAGMPPGALMPRQERTMQEAPSPRSLSPEGLELTKTRLTLQPRRNVALPAPRSEIRCAVLNWDPRLPKPLLSLVCPPREVFAPVHVYLTYTWSEVADVPKNFAQIVASAGSPTKLKTRRNQVHIWLKVHEQRGDNARWIPFNQLYNIGLVGG